MAFLGPVLDHFRAGLGVRPPDGCGSRSQASRFRSQHMTRLGLTRITQSQERFLSFNGVPNIGAVKPMSLSYLEYPR